MKIIGWYGELSVIRVIMKLMVVRLCELYGYASYKGVKLMTVCHYSEDKRDEDY